MIGTIILTRDFKYNRIKDGNFGLRKKLNRIYSNKLYKIKIN